MLIREYGIKEVSMEQYKTVCDKIIRFVSEKGSNSYTLIRRPKSNYQEIFLTVKEPVKPLVKRRYSFTGLCDKYFTQAKINKIPGRGFHSLRQSFATELSKAGVPIETISQLLGHQSIEEDKPYLSYNKEQIAFYVIGFDEIPITNGIYAGGDQNDYK